MSKNQFLKLKFETVFSLANFIIEEYAPIFWPHVLETIYPQYFSKVISI